MKIITKNKSGETIEANVIEVTTTDGVGIGYAVGRFLTAAEKSAAPAVSYSGYDLMPHRYATIAGVLEAARRRGYGIVL